MNECKRCGAPIPPRPATGKGGGRSGYQKIYCGDECRTRFRVEEQSAQRVAARTDLSCDNCGKTFTPQRNARPGRGTFCSKACSSRAGALRVRFSITPEDYRALFEAQQGVCAICGRPPARKALAVDHDHHTGYLRGLLCDTDNRFTLGRKRGESGALLLARAADYLRNPPGRRVIPGHRVSATRPNGKPWADE